MGVWAGGDDKSSPVSSPWLMDPSLLCSTGRENAPLVLSEDKHFDAHITSQTPLLECYSLLFSTVSQGMEALALAPNAFRGMLHLSDVSAET